MAGLSVRNLQFVRAYLSGPTRGNAHASAVAAGYTDDSGAAARLLHSPKIKRAVAERLRRHDITADRVLAELSKVAFSDMREYTSWGPDGVTLKPSGELSDFAGAAVSEVSETKGDKSESLKFKLHDKVGALTVLAKHLRLVDDKGVNVNALGPLIVTWSPDGSSSPTPLARSNPSSTPALPSNGHAPPASSAIDDLERL